MIRTEESNNSRNGERISTCSQTEIFMNPNISNINCLSFFAHLGVIRVQQAECVDTGEGLERVV